MIRDPSRSFGGSYTGRVSISRWGWRAASFESLLEMHWILQKDLFTLDLERLESQPFKFVYRFDGRDRIWIPDFAYKTKGRSRVVLVEIKPLRRLYPRDPAKRAWEKARWEAIATKVQSKGMRFELFTENEIRVQPRLDNAMAMLAGSNRLFPRDLEAAAISALLRLPSTSTPRDLELEMGRPGHGFRAAMRLTWLGAITMPAGEIWNIETAFSRRAREVA